MLLIGLINNTPRIGESAPPFNLAGSLLIIALVFLAWLGSTLVLAKFVQNNPRSVQIEQDKLTVQGTQGQELEVSFADVEYVRKAEVPVTYWKLKASFRGLLLHYKEAGSDTEKDYVLSDRDTTNFDELMEQMKIIVPRNRPKPKTKPKTETKTEISQQEKKISDYEEAKVALRGQSELLTQTLRGLSAEEWKKPSKLAGWDIFTLAAHTMRAPETIIRYGAKPVDEAAQLNHVSYYEFNGPDIAEGVSQRAIESAAKSSPETLPDEFSQIMTEALALLDKWPGSTVIRSAFGTITLEEFIPTRIVELTIHGLDLFLALNQPAEYDVQALKITAEILDKLLSEPRPTALADDANFVAAASGRIPYPGLLIPAFS